jgi:hypothetical protein
MEPVSVNTLVEESEELKRSVLEGLSGEIPSQLRHLFNETNMFFQDEVLSQWRNLERYDELIDYIVYQYGEQGGEDLWKQVLLDLRLNKDVDKAIRLLDGLLPGRMGLYKSASKNSKKFPNNYLSAVSLSVITGEVMKVLYEYAFLLENQSADMRDEAKIKYIKGLISKSLKLKN